MNLLWGKIRHSIGLGLDLLYPPRCGGCGATGQGWWCPTCSASEAALGAEGITRAMLDDGRPLLEIAWARFAPPLREGIHALKYGGSPQLAGPFGERMARAWQAGAPDWAADLVAPIGRCVRLPGTEQYDQMGTDVASDVKVRSLEDVKADAQGLITH